MTDQPPQYARCPVCKEASFPVHVLSPCGHDAAPTLHALDGVGEVYSWTRTHGADGPVLIAMADFLGGELRVSATVTGVESVSIGDRLAVLPTDGTDFTLAPGRSG